MNRALQAIASTFRGDEKSRELGRYHALRGMSWSPGDTPDAVAYSLGFADGQSERECCSGERADGERVQ